jgi:hypothetical protein
MTSSLAMRSWEASQGKVTRLFMHGLLRGELGSPGASALGSPWEYLGRHKNGLQSMALGRGSQSPQGYLKSKNSLSASAQPGLFWMLLTAVLFIAKRSG